MVLSVRERELLIRLAGITAFSAVGAAIYLATISATSATSTWIGALAGGLTGATIGAACGGFELFFIGRPRGERFRKLPFAVNLGLRTTFYAVAIVGAIWLWTVVFYSEHFRWRMPQRCDFRD